MRERALPELFEDFRARGDAEALGQVFDRSAPELLRLASHLAPDLAEAEDLVQQTFVTAIERAARFDGERDLLAWLIGILAQHARNAARRRARRADPRALERPEGEGPQRALEGRELSELLHVALAKLPEPERELMRRHLLEGERAADIARATGRAAGTVRMRIARGLERLRRALPASAALATTSGTRGLAAVRAAVMERAAELGAGLAAPSAITTAAGIGGLAMGTKLGIGAALALALFALSSWLGDRSAAPALPAIARQDARVERGVSAQPLAERADPIAPEGARQPASEPAAHGITLRFPLAFDAPDAPGWWLVGEIRGAGRELASPIAIHATCRDGGTESAGGSAPGDGRYALDVSALCADPLLARRELLVSFGHFELEAHYLPLSVDLDALRRQPGLRKELRADVELRPSAGFTGRVELPDGAPAEGARVGLLFRDGAGRPLAEADCEAVCDAKGAFALKSSKRGACFVVASLDGHLPRALEREIAGPGFVELGELRLELGSAEIRGRVELPASARGLRVHIHAFRERDATDDGGWSWSDLHYNGQRFVPTMRYTWSDGEGAFVLAGLDAGASYTVGIERLDAQSIAVDPGQLEIRAPAEGVVLGRGLGLLTAQVFADGQPIEGAHVGFRNEHGEMGWRTDADGRLRVLLERSRDYLVLAGAPGCTETQVESLGATRPADAHLSLALHSRAAELASLGLDLALIDGHGLPDPQLFLARLGAKRADHPSASAFERRDGALWLDGLEPDRYELCIEPGGFDVGLGASCFYLPAELRVDLTAGGSQRVRVPLALGGSVRVRCVGMDASALAARVELRNDRQQLREARFVTREERGNETVVGTRADRLLLRVENALHPALPPGSYELRAELDGHRAEPLRFTVAAGASQVLTLRFERE